MSWLMKSDQTSATLAMAMDFPRAWRLALLFFISGMGTWFAFRSSGGLDFLISRVTRLGIPLLFAMCVIVVPQVWYERMYYEGYQGSFLTFWVERYFTEGKYPTGNFTWAHMWFVAYLLVMAVVFYPVSRLIVQPRMRPVTDWFERVARSKAVYLFFLLPLALNLLLSPIFPRETNALYNDGAWFAVWTSWYGLGFLFARHHRSLISSIVARRWASATLAAVITLILYRYSWTQGGEARLGSYEHMTAAYKVLIFALAWSMILMLTGFAALHLNRKSATLAWLNHKIFPLYIVHQTVIIAALYHVLPLDLGLLPKIALVMGSTVVVSLSFAMAADQLPWPLRTLVGLTGDPTGAKEKAKARAPLHG